MSPSSTQPRSGFLHQSGAVVGSINLFFDAALRKPTSIYRPLNFSTKPEQHSFCTAQIIASFGVKLAYDVKIAGNHCKQKARNFSVYQEVSGFALLKLEITVQSASSWGQVKEGSQMALFSFISLSMRLSFSCSRTSPYATLHNLPAIWCKSGVVVGVVDFRPKCPVYRSDL